MSRLGGYDSGEPAPNNGANGWLARVLWITTVVWIVVMVASLRWHFLDRFVVRTSTDHIGFDFFQTPRGYNNLVGGNNIFCTRLGDYGPYASPYLYHPFVAVLVGPWTAPLAPWVGYGVFVGVSLGLLFLGGWLLASSWQAPAERGLVYCALFCTLPTYILLLEGQSHVLLIVAVALILGGLLRLEQQPELASRWTRWIQLGLLLSLLSKPIVVLMLPVLFLLPETRRALLLPLALYAVISWLFLVCPGLNPGGYNSVHWLNIMLTASSPVQAFPCVVPAEYNLLKDPELYSLPIFLGRIFARAIPSLLLKLPLGFILLMSFSPLLLPERGQRLRSAIVIVSLCILSHYLCYYPVHEYHYTTLLPVLPVLLWLWRRESVPWLRRLLMTCFVVSLVVFLPTPRFLAPTEANRFWAISSVQRVLPVLVAFLCLAVYGVAFAWRARPRRELITRQMTARIWPALGLGGALGMILASVPAAAYWTAPPRLLVMPSKWTSQDWNAHYAETTAECRRALEIAPRSAEAHNNLGVILQAQGRIGEAIAEFQQALETAPDNVHARHFLGNALACHGRTEEALLHYRRATEIAPRDVEARCELGNALASQGRYDEAISQYEKAVELQPDSADAHYSLGNALTARGRPDEAIAQYQRALELRPNDAMACNNLGNVLAGQGRLDEALTQYRQALEIEPDHAASHSNLGNFLAAEGRFDQAIAHYRKALEIQPDNVGVQRKLAWLWATCPVASWQNGAEAIELAQRANQSSGNRRPDVLDTLAAAYAQAGWFPEALATAHKALELATQQGNGPLVEGLRSRIALYAAGKPYRQTAPRPLKQ